MWAQTGQNQQRVQQQLELVLIEEQRNHSTEKSLQRAESRSWNNRGWYQAVCKRVESIKQGLGFISVIRYDVRD